MAEPQSKSARRWLIAAIKLLIVAAVLWFIRGTVVNAIEELRKSPPTLDYGWLAASAGFYLLGMLPAGLFWWIVMRALGQRPGLAQSLRAYVVGHLGKYVPGKALVVVVRAGLIRGPNVNSTLAAVAVFVETLTMMASGAFLAAAILGAEFGRHRWVLVGSLILMALSTIPTLPPVFRRLVPLLRVGRSDPQIAHKLSGLNYRVLAAGWFLLTLMWIGWGLSLWAVLRGMGMEELSAVHYADRVTAAIALATVAGFFSMIPGGLVVREAVLMEVLGPFVPGLGKTEAAIAAALLRLVWLVAEIVISIILYMGMVLAKIRRPLTEGSED